MAQQPDASLPKQTGGGKDLKAGYRLLSNPEVDPQAIQGPHRLRTAEACAGYPVVLSVQDTTELDFSHRKRMTGLGRIGDGGGRGLVQHTALAVAPGDDVAASPSLLGVLDERWYRRVQPPEGETRRARQARWSEAQVWSDAAEAVAEFVAGATPGATPGGVPGAGEQTRLVHVGDRHSDVFGFMHRCRQLGQGFVIRAMHDRYVEGDDGAAPTRLYARLERESPVFTMTVGVGLQREGKRPRRAREARVAVGYTPVRVPPPRNDPRTADAEAIDGWALLIREDDPPEDAEALRWVLLTREPVRTEADARRVIGYYRARWMIEEWHRVLKEGCRVEKSQLDDAEDAKRLAAIQSVVAVRLLQLRELADRAGDDVEALQGVVPALWIAIAAALAGVQPHRLTPRAFWRTLARQGGHLGRARDPRPGWKVIWRGWYDLQRMAQGAQLLGKDP